MSRDDKLTRIKLLYKQLRPGTNLGPRTFAYKQMLKMTDDQLDELVARLEKEDASRQINARDDKSEDYVPLCIDTSLPLGNQGCGGGQRIIRKQGGYM